MRNLLFFWKTVTRLGPDRRRILLVFTTVPWPLRAHGVSVRYLPLVSRSYDIDLMLICGRAGGVQDVDGLQKHCRRITLLPDPRREAHDAVSKGRTYANDSVEVYNEIRSWEA